MTVTTVENKWSKKKVWAPKPALKKKGTEKLVNVYTFKYMQKNISNNYL